MKYEDVFKKYLGGIEKTLDAVIPASPQHPPVIHEAMRYSVFPGGKRFRPVITLAACEAVGGKAKDALIPAAAIELIHSYSLVHDDLPALDNADERRGKPSCHKRFGEAMAVLTGDGLLNTAFQILADIKPRTKVVPLLREISTAAGIYGMIGGQVADLASTGSDLDIPTLDFISIHKTGKLIKASAVCGAIMGGASKEVRRHIARYGESVGLAFQSVDDLIDGDGYLRILKPSEARDKVRDLIALAKREIRPLGRRAKKLMILADFILERTPSEAHVPVD
ncbi:MAG: polyprenyl synthetase family protein [Candidatus Omnitrophota bacterium]|nr:polyprenyl synthetase family protein [Candidatus Omnitrophota bacterium]